MTTAPPRFIRNGRLAGALATVVLALALGLGAATSGAVGLPAFGHNTSALPALARGALRQSAPPAAVATLRSYTIAFRAGRFAAMWHLLAPTARAGWGGLTAYTSFYRAKFAPVRVLGLRMGAPRVTGRTVWIPLSLDLAWRAAGPPGVLLLFHHLDATLVQQSGRWQVLDGGPLDPTAPIIPPAQPPARTLRVPILMYHHVSSVPPLAQSQLGLTVSDDAFAGELDYLATHGYQTVRLIDLFNALYYGRPLPPRPIVLTFDDGYLDNYSDAFPLLRRHHMVGEFNIITAYPGITLGVNRYMTWAQIGALAAAGMEVESHTIDHQDLGLLDAGQDGYELRFSRQMLATRLGRPVQFLAYPSGEPFRSGSLEAQQRLLSLLPRYGYVGALLDQRAPSMLQDARRPYGLNRVRVDRGETIDQFAASVQS